MTTVTQNAFRASNRALFLVLIVLCLCHCLCGCGRKESTNEAFQVGVTGGKDTQAAWFLRKITRNGDEGPWEVLTVVIVKGETSNIYAGTDSTCIVRPDGKEVIVQVDSAKQFWVNQANHVKKIEQPLSVKAVMALADLESSENECVLDQFEDLEELRSFLLRRSVESHNTQTDAEQ